MKNISRIPSFRYYLPLLALGLSLALLFSCKKEPMPGGGGSGNSLAINLSYHANNPDIQKFELIISERGGKVLLDTIAPVETNIPASLKTKEKLVDLTTVYFDSLGGAQYSIATYTSVDPSTWTTIYNNFSTYITPGFNPAFAPATIHYSNAPSSAQPFFTDDPEPTGDATLTPGPGTLDVSYLHRSGAYNYLLLPDLKLYNLHNPASNADTVDLSHMDTAVGVTYATPPGVQLLVSNLNIYTDTSDPARYLNVYLNLLINSPYDVEYPIKHVEKYEFVGVWGNFGTSEFNSYYTYGAGFPSAGSVPFIDATDYTLGSNLPDSFSIQFTGIHPSYYEPQWTAGAITWNVFASADSATIHPLRILTAQHSKLLAGQSLTAFHPGRLVFENAMGASYSYWLDYIFNPSLLNKKLLQNSIVYTKSF